MLSEVQVRLLGVFVAVLWLLDEPRGTDAMGEPPLKLETQQNGSYPRPYFLLRTFFLASATGHFRCSTKFRSFQAETLVPVRVRGSSCCCALSPHRTCGLRTARRARVVGGQVAYDGEFPWLVSVQFVPSMGENKCGGTILNERWILTAAHCFYGYQKSNFVVRVAEYNLRAKEPRTPAITYTIDQLIMHPDYRKVKKYDNDIALVRLSRKIRYSEYAQPACLPSLTLADTTGINVTVVGWGQVSEDVPKTPAVPLKAVLTVFDNQICNTWLHNHSMRVLDNHMCAGLEEGGKDACHGDSGGPLLALNNRRYVVVGVVAAGDGCALPRTPGIYTRVTAFLPWIMDHIAPDSGDIENIARF
ncbi:hypothetical protein HPB49_011106 [Dermacentor silvarum]|uniref:Uncharacterized protein n=1 Tax=Dermacentor silvarum TaxID=543639 RepID=A0ACB8CKT1_DERSI|nr:hypothetical protein HPB49_011106 [Dermacentor silvarum]